MKSVLSWVLVALSFLISPTLTIENRDLILRAEFEKALLNQEALSVPDLIAQEGYQSETHTVHTGDGYILELHRIPSSARTGKPKYGPVLILHGTLSSSADFVVTGKDHALAFFLSDAGYDVWLGNSRGNTNSRKHISLNPAQAAFWQFSWHEMGTQDLPSIIDYVLAISGSEKLSYIGHSQGTTEFFVLASEKPEYNAKIRSAHMLAPVAYSKHLPSPILRLMVPFLDSLEWLSKTLGINEFLPSSDFIADVGKMFCHDQTWTQILCKNIYFLLAGYNPDQLNATTIPAILQNVPAGAATKQLIHYGQGVRTGEFQQYNYGWWKNQQIYGQSFPPKYNLKKITTPICLYWSDKDKLASPKDVKRLASALPNLAVNHRVDDKAWTHVDFLWGIDAVQRVYQPLLANLNQLHNSTKILQQ